MTSQGFRQTRLAVIISGVIAVVLCWAAVGGWLWHERNQTLSTAEDQLRRLSVITAEMTNRLLSLADVFLDNLESVLRASGDDWMVSPAAAERITRFHAQVEGAVNVGVIDADGTAHFLSGELINRTAAVGDRDYFRAAQVGQLTVAAPVKGRLTGEWVIPLSRRFDPPAGHVAAAFVALQVPTLERLYDRIRPGMGGAMALVRSDGMLLARAPHRDELMGRVFAGPLFREHLPQSPNGVYTDISAIDGSMRTVAYRTVEPYGLVLNVSAERDQILAGWRDLRTMAVIGALLVAALIAIAAAVILRLIDQLEHGARDLDRRVRERTGELERAVQSRSKFLASMSHELRTPLNAILGFSDALKTGVFGALAERHVSYVNDIHTSGGLLLALVNDLLDIAALDAGRLSLAENEIDPVEVIADALGMVRQRAETAKIALVMEPPTTRHRLFADRRRLLQTVLNILTNAIKYNRPGGRVRLSCGMEDGGDYVITLADDGPGMSAEVLELAMTPFGRSSDPAVRAIDGAGLGLPLAASLMELHGGRLDVDSIAGRGTTVRLRLPAFRVRKSV